MHVEFIKGGGKKLSVTIYLFSRDYCSFIIMQNNTDFVTWKTKKKCYSLEKFQAPTEKKEKKKPFLL